MDKLPIEFWESSAGVDIILGMMISGKSLKEVSKVMGVTIKTLKNLSLENEMIRDAISMTPFKANIAVETALYKKALSGNVSACIHWLRTKDKANWCNTANKDDEEKIGMTDFIINSINSISSISSNEENTAEFNLEFSEDL